MSQNKTSSLNAAILLSSIVALVAVGCGGVEPPDPYTPPTGNGVNNDPNKNNNNNNNNNGKKVQKPTVDAQANTACTASIPLTGRGPIGASILVKGGAGDISTDTHSVTGRFCVDVKLYKNTTNTLKVYALDPQLGLSAPTTISITHTKCNLPTNPNPTPTEKSKNQALGAKVKSDETPKAGQNTAITDGDATTYAQYTGGWLGWAAKRVVMVNLGKLVQVDKIKIKWRHSSSSSTQHYAAEYEMYTATGTPGDLTQDNTLWTKIKTVKAGSGGVETHELKNKGLMVQHVGIIMMQDGESYTSSETFDLSEIEVWDLVKKSTTPTNDPKSKTCSDIDTSI